MTVAISKAIRAALAEAGYGRRDVSVHNDSYSMGSTVHVKIKRPEISLTKVEAIADSFAHVDRDESGEILGGGNCFVSVEYADGALDAAAGRINDQVVAGRRHFGDCELVVKDQFTFQIWHTGRAGMHVDRKAPGAGLARDLARLEQFDTLDQWDESAFAVAHRDALVTGRAADPHSPLPGFTAPAAPANGNDEAEARPAAPARLIHPKPLGIDEMHAATSSSGEPDPIERIAAEAAALSPAQRRALVERINAAAALLAAPSAADVATVLHRALDAAYGDDAPDPATDTRSAGNEVTLTLCSGAAYRIRVERTA